MLNSFNSFSTMLGDIATYFSMPTIGGLYHGDYDNMTKQMNTLVRQLNDFFKIGMPLYIDKCEERGGNEIGTQILVGGVGSGTSASSESSPSDKNVDTTGSLVKIMDNVVVNPRSWVMHGYLGFKLENPVSGTISNALTYTPPIVSSFVRTFGRNALNTLIKKFIRYINEARRPFKFTTAEGETFPALIKSYSFSDIVDNGNYIECDLEIQEFRFLALLDDTQQKAIGGAEAQTGMDAAKQLGRKALVDLSMKAVAM